MRPRHDLVLENVLAATPTHGADSADPGATARSASHLGHAALDPGTPIPRRLAWPPDVRHARHGCALAPAGLAPLLALEVPVPRRTSSSQPRGAGAHQDHVAREPT